VKRISAASGSERGLMIKRRSLPLAALIQMNCEGAQFTKVVVEIASMDWALLPESPSETILCLIRHI
jgi:hypothetical protein